jgi:hypothetical protein
MDNLVQAISLVQVFEVDQGPRRSMRTMKKQPGSHPR